MSTAFSRLIQGYLAQDASASILHVLLSESKHISTHPGASRLKDTITAQHRAMIPNLTGLTSRQHARQRDQLTTVTDNFRQFATRRLNAVRLGQVRPSVGLKDLKDEFRNLYRTSFAMGLRGSHAHLAPQQLLTPEDDRWIESAFRHEMRYFNSFLDQVLNGRLTPNQINWRLGLYMLAARSIYDAGRVTGSHPNSLIYWIYNPEAQHCESCLYLREHSPYTKRTLPTTPRSGATQCLSNCKCHLRFVVADPEVIAQNEARALSKEYHLRELGRMKRTRGRSFARESGERFDCSHDRLALTESVILNRPAFSGLG